MGRKEGKRAAEGPARKAESERIRAATDTGSLGEKVRHPDPAAAPLDADDEAGGAPGYPDSEEPVPDQAQPAAERTVINAGMLGVAIIAGGIAVVALIVWGLIAWIG